MTFFLASIYWQRASSITKGLLREAMALKSKLSRLFTAPNRAALIRRSTHAPLPFDQFQLRQTKQILHIVLVFSGALFRQFFIIGEEGRQAQLFQMMMQEEFGGLAHGAASSARRFM